MKKILISVGLVMVCSVFANAQKLQTAKGYLCGMEEGDGGYASVRVGTKVVGFAMYNDEPEVRYIGFKERSMQEVMGSEMVIAYVKKTKFRRPANVVRTITLTGRSIKKIKPCS